MDLARMLLELYHAEQDNHYDDKEAGALFDPPIFAVADAADAWFDRLKQVIGVHHLTPREALELSTPGTTARSVICWSLPVAELPRRTNRAETLLPSRAWAYARMQADGIMLRMTRGLEEALRKLGHAAVGPAQSPEVAKLASPHLSTCWSQRHVAFVAGLGTFGISGGLITVRGIAHRLGSVVTDAAIAPTPRPYGDDPFAWCLKSARNTCGACIKRCPVGSIGLSVHERNKDACANHRETVRAAAGDRYGWKSNHYGCALCQTNVPCETCNPTAD